MPSTDDERRYFVVRSSDELCEGHEEHHAAFHKLARDVTRLRDFYDYLMKMQVKRQLTKAETQSARTSSWCTRAIATMSSGSSSRWRTTSRLIGSCSLDRALREFVAFCASESITSVLTRHALPPSSGRRSSRGSPIEFVYDAVAKGGADL